jgi:hypothetical protein
LLVGDRRGVAIGRRDEGAVALYGTAVRRLSVAARNAAIACAPHGA